MRKHSPGPWRWNENRPAKYDLDWLCDVHGNRILTIYSNGEITPDKALLGAAPDLLAAAKFAHQALLTRIPGSVEGGAAACELLLQAILLAEPITEDNDEHCTG